MGDEEFGICKVEVFVSRGGGLSHVGQWKPELWRVLLEASEKQRDREAWNK